MAGFEDPSMMMNFTFSNIAAATHAEARWLSGTMTDAEAFKISGTVSQVFSGVFFTGLAFWLSFTNGTKLGFIQAASLEKRLTVCCFLDTYVAAFSAFFNFFQLTEVQYIVLPRQTSYTLNLARPVEWICTCPIMQLVLVLMGGSRIPDYRRMLMPGLSLGLLITGFAGCFVQSPWTYVAFAAAFLVALVMFFINRIQIIEHSQGQECLWHGDSEFRKATILMMITWSPFPLWFALSPEGFELIDNVLVIQVGWAFLNIVSKFSFIFYIQRIKDNYCSRLKVKRELLGSQKKMDEAFGSVTPVENTLNKAQGELTAVTVETMSFLGMAQHTDRFMRLLRRADVTSLDQIEKFTRETADKAQLPWDLVSALQKRFRVWKMEMQDTAELELEKGEQHYMAEDPLAPAMRKLQALEASGDNVGPHMPMGHPYNVYAPGTITPTGQMTPPGSIPSAMLLSELNKGIAAAQAESMQMHMYQQGAVPAGIPGMPAAEMEARFERMEELLYTVMQKAEGIQTALIQQQQESEANLARRLEYMVGQALATAQRTHEVEVEGSLKQRMEELVGSAAERLRATSEALGHSLQAKVDDYSTKITQLESDAKTSWIRRIEDSVAKSAEQSNRAVDNFARNTTRAIETVGRDVQAKSDTQGAASQRRLEELETNLGRRLEEMTGKVTERCERVAEATRSAMQADLGTVMGRSDLVGEAVREANHATKEGIADLRRMSMMVLEQASGAQERSQGHAAQLSELRGTVDAGLERIATAVSDLKWTAQLQKPLMQHQGMGGEDLHMQMGPTGHPGSSRRPMGNYDEGMHGGRQTAKYGMQVISG